MASVECIIFNNHMGLSELLDGVYCGNFPVVKTTVGFHVVFGPAVVENNLDFGSGCPFCKMLSSSYTCSLLDQLFSLCHLLTCVGAPRVALVLFCPHRQGDVFGLESKSFVGNLDPHTEPRNFVTLRDCASF